jgi:hypothetical protein
MSPFQLPVGYITVPIELLQEGDHVISRNENDPNGPLVAGVNCDASGECTSPKSTSFTAPCGARSRLAGLMSR